MGANEDELASIAAAGPFRIPELPALRNSLAALAVTMKDIAGSPGWEGMSADAAAAWFETLSRQYFDLEGFIGDLQREVDRANEIRTAALADYAALPSATAPSWVHGTLEAFDFPGLPDPVDLAQGGLAIIEGFLGGQREAAAGRILAAYTEALAEPALRTDAVITTVNSYTITMGGDLPEAPDTDTDTDTTGSWNGGGAYRGGGSPGVQYRAPGGYPLPTGRGEDPVEIGVDDPSVGILPGGGSGNGSGGGGSTGPHAPGGGLGGGVGGVGIGTAVAGAGALAAARFGGGAAGLAGAAARPGAGGLLGAGAPGSAGAARTAGAARGAGASGARGQGLLGHGAARSGSDKERTRTAGRGLGGPIAPHLDDEDDLVLPGDGARAGGRDDVAEPSLPGD